MSTRNYSFRQQPFSWNGIDFGEGAAVDGYTEASDAGSRTVLAHADGGRTVAEETNRGGTVTISLSTESKAHSTMVALEQSTAGSAPVVADGLINDQSSGRAITYRNMFVLSRGDETRAVAASAVSWVLSYEKRETVEPTDLANVVGA
jgi:hypothetical protein